MNQEKAEHSAQAGRKTVSMAVNVVLVLLVLLVGYLSFAFVERTFFRPSVDSERAGEDLAGVIQLDVMNGCGDAGMASKCSSFLRARGFDVVEMRNYKTFDLGHLTGAVSIRPPKVLAKATVPAIVPEI